MLFALFGLVFMQHPMIPVAGQSDTRQPAATGKPESSADGGEASRVDDTTEGLTRMVRSGSMTSVHYAGRHVFTIEADERSVKRVFNGVRSPYRVDVHLDQDETVISLWTDHSAFIEAYVYTGGSLAVANSELRAEIALPGMGQIFEDVHESVEELNKRLRESGFDEEELRRGLEALPDDVRRRHERNEKLVRELDIEMLESQLEELPDGHGDAEILRGVIEELRSRGQRRSDED